MNPLPTYAGKEITGTPTTAFITHEGKNYEYVPPAPVTPAPAASTPTGSLVDRYGAERTAIDTNPALNVQNPDQDTVRNQYRNYAQSTVDAIRSQYDKYINDDTEAKQRVESGAYLRSLANGLSGAPTGATQVTRAADKGQLKVQQDINDREQAIAKAYGDADLRASTEFNNRRTEYLNSAKDKYGEEQKLNGQVKTAAEGELATFAAHRTYDDWSKEAGPQRVQQYMKETGLDENGIKALFLKNVKNDLVSDTGTKNADGSISFYKKTYDANGNITGVKEVATIKGAGDGKTIKDSRITDNGVQILYTDGTYKTIGSPGNNGSGSGSGSDKPIPGTPAGFTNDDIEQGRTLFKKFGHGGFAEPAFYVDAYQNWINKGGKPSKFLELYPPNEFVNPTESNLLPSYLRPDKAASKAPVDDTSDTTTAPSGDRSF